MNKFDEIIKEEKEPTPKEEAQLVPCYRWAAMLDDDKKIALIEELLNDIKKIPHSLKVKIGQSGTIKRAQLIRAVFDLDGPQDLSLIQKTLDEKLTGEELRILAERLALDAFDEPPDFVRDFARIMKYKHIEMSPEEAWEFIKNNGDVI